MSPSSLIVFLLLRCLGSHHNIGCFGSRQSAREWLLLVNHLAFGFWLSTSDDSHVALHLALQTVSLFECCRCCFLLHLF